MKLISTKTHGILDYLVGILLIVAPWLLNFANGSPAQTVPVTLGIIILAMALLTKYELGLFKVISMQTHLALDVLAGLFLALSPWLFGFNEYVYLPHLIVGIFIIVSGVLTDKVPVVAPRATITTNPNANTGSTIGH